MIARGSLEARGLKVRTMRPSVRGKVLAGLAAIATWWAPAATAQTPSPPPPDHPLAFVAVSTTDPGLQVVDLETLELGPYLRVEAPLASVVASPDGRMVYAVTSEGIVPMFTDTLDVGQLIEVPGAWRMAVSPDGTRAYVADTSFNNVVPVDLTAMTAEPPIPVPGRPFDLVYSPDGETVWVAVVETEELTPVDVATDTLGVPIDVGVSPRDVAISSDGSHVYATNILGGSGPAGPVLQPINVGTRVVGPFIPLPENVRAQEVEVTADDSTAYVTDSSGDQLTPVDLASATAEPPIACCDRPLGFAITPDGATAYVASFFGGELVPINLNTQTPSDGIPTGDSSLDVALVGPRSEPPPPPEPPPAPSIPMTPSFTG